MPFHISPALPELEGWDETTPEEFKFWRGLRLRRCIGRFSGCIGSKEKVPLHHQLSFTFRSLKFT